MRHLRSPATPVVRPQGQQGSAHPIENGVCSPCGVHRSIEHWRFCRLNITLLLLSSQTMVPPPQTHFSHWNVREVHISPAVVTIQHVRRTCPQPGAIGPGATLTLQTDHTPPANTQLKQAVMSEATTVVPI